MKLHHDWRRILTHAWSVRFWLAAILCGSLETTLPLLAGENVLLTAILSGLATLFGIAGLYARAIQQKVFENGK